MNSSGSSSRTLNRQSGKGTVAPEPPPGFRPAPPGVSLRDSFVVSGSSRTALGLLGFHCGIREVIVPDLSWTYEHCFPSVCAVPLTPGVALDADAIISVVQGQARRGSALEPFRRGRDE